MRVEKELAPRLSENHNFEHTWEKSNGCMSYEQKCIRMWKKTEKND